MQTCYNCGKEVSDQTLICPDCGALVRRYNDAPPRNDPEPQPQSARPQPIPVDQTVDPRHMRFHGILKVWLIVMIVVSAYMMLTCAASVIIGSNEQVVLDMYSEVGMELPDYFIEALDVFAESTTLFTAMAFLFACKLGCHIWLLAGRKKIAFYVSIGVSMAALICFLFLGGGFMDVLYFLDPLVTWLNLRRYWPYMR